MQESPLRASPSWSLKVVTATKNTSLWVLYRRGTDSPPGLNSEVWRCAREPNASWEHLELAPLVVRHTPLQHEVFPARNTEAQDSTAVITVSETWYWGRSHNATDSSVTTCAQHQFSQCRSRVIINQVTYLCRENKRSERESLLVRKSSRNSP